MKLSKISALFAATALTMGLAQMPAQAAQINGLLIGGVNTVQDSDAERILRGGNTVTSGAFQVGDVIQAILRFDTANAGNIGDNLPAPYQLNAYVELGIGAIIDTGIAVPGGALGNFQRLIFTPTGNLGAGVFAEFYERTSAAQPSFNLSLSANVGVANVLAQTLIAEIGIGDIDDFWGSTVVNDIGFVASQGNGSAQQTNGEFGLSVVNNPGGLNFVPNAIISGTDGNLHDIVGSSSAFVRESGVNSDWLVSSNTEARFVSVPEPGIMSLIALGLLGLGANLRKRKSV